MVLEVCDVCKKEITDDKGIRVKIDNFEYWGSMATRSKKKYKAHICRRCVNRIKLYCRERTNV